MSNKGWAFFDFDLLFFILTSASSKWSIVQRSYVNQLDGVSPSNSQTKPFPRAELLPWVNLSTSNLLPVQRETNSHVTMTHVKGDQKLLEPFYLYGLSHVPHSYIFFQWIHCFQSWECIIISPGRAIQPAANPRYKDILKISIDF